MDEITMRPIGRVERSGDSTWLQVDEVWRPALLGLDGYSHLIVIWCFDQQSRRFSQGPKELQLERESGPSGCLPPGPRTAPIPLPCRWSGSWGWISRQAGWRSTALKPSTVRPCWTSRGIPLKSTVYPMQWLPTGAARDMAANMAPHAGRAPRTDEPAPSDCVPKRKNASAWQKPAEAFFVAETKNQERRRLEARAESSRAP